MEHRLTDRRIERLVHGVYEAAVDRAGWPPLVAEWSDALGGAAINLVLDIGHLSSGATVFGHALDDAFQRAWIEHRSLDPFIPRLLCNEEGRFGRSEEVIGPREFERSDCYNVVWRPFGLLPGPTVAATLQSENGVGTSFVSILRPCGQRAIEGRREALCRRLVPHLVRAVRIDREMAAARSAARDLRGALDASATPIFIVGADAVVRHQNAAAEVLLARRDGVRLEAGCLRARERGENRVLLGLVASSLAAVSGDLRPGGGTVTFSRANGRRLVAVVLPLSGAALRGGAHAAAAVFVHDPDLQPPDPRALLRTVYGLTQAEAALAAELAAGESLADACERLEIRMHTARSQLKTVFAKTDVRRQAELVALVHRCVGTVDTER